MRRAVRVALLAGAAARPRPSPNASLPYFVERWDWPAPGASRGPHLSRRDYRLNDTFAKDGCAPSTVVCVATKKNAPARLSGAAAAR